MEDQVLSSGPEASRPSAFTPDVTAPTRAAVCKAYLEGELDFLFIAPER